MRNIFDQYTQPENRVTHALVTALYEDRALLWEFLKEVAGSSPPRGHRFIEIFEQTYPGELESQDEEETERRGIPDAWITVGDDWCLVVENKVLDAATADQLTRHLTTAKRLGYADPQPLVLTVRSPDGEMPHGTRVVEWCTVYRWLVDKSPQSPWARRVTQFLEVMEGRLIDQQQLTVGALTAFNGFPFDSDNPFSYLEAKRILRLATTELRNREDLELELGMARDLPGRSAITGKDQDNIWDFLQLGAARGAKNFREFPHLTLDIGRNEVGAKVIVPNGLRRQSLRRLVDLGPQGFKNLIGETLDRMGPILAACEGMEPRLSAAQRRYQTRRSVPFYDARINFDLRTSFDGIGPPMTQPQWMDAVYGCLAEKKSNFQIGIGASFPYRTCEAIKSPDALNYVAGAWIACRPLIKLLISDSSA